jgi:hypothetical protein
MDKFNYISSHSRADGFVMGVPYPIYSNACGTGNRNLCLNKCDAIHATAVIPCNFKINTKKNKAKDKCFDSAAQKRNACKSKCPSADQACIEEKNNPSGGVSDEPVKDEAPEKEPVDSGSSEGSGDNGSGIKKVDGKKFLLYSAVVVAGVAGISLLVWGVASAVKHN